MQEPINEIIRQAQGARSQEELNLIKLNVARQHGLAQVPTNIELSRHGANPLFSIKPTRLSSGVNVIAIMTKPIACPHGRCTYCPGGPGSVFGDVPQSYTGNEPASMRAIRSKFDAYMQVMSRLEAYAAMGKLMGKIELIIMGGTYPSFEQSYQDEFATGALEAMNSFSREFFTDEKFDTAKFEQTFEPHGSMRDGERQRRVQQRLLTLKKQSTLAATQAENETARIRCVALCVETKPDWCFEPHIETMLRLGTTRIELGVQCLTDDVLKRTNRGHTVADSVKATQLLKDALLKVGYHLMPGQPGSTLASDERMLREVFDNPELRPDAIKIYPCLVMPGTPLFEQWKRGEFTPMETDAAAELIANAKPHIPTYCRVMRIQRDIPTKVTASGVDKTNLRQIVEDKLKEKGIVCRCIRCREPRGKKIDTDAIKLIRTTYEASGGTEVFLSYEDTANDFVLGYARLRILTKSWRPGIPVGSAGIRELHVFGDAAAVGTEGKIQHRGLGSKLMAEAERIAREEFSANKILVISGIGAREYYRHKLGYERNGAYMSKRL